jgi:mannose-6-phosphate isomerase-like protein (cupin superfamily)
VRALIAAVFATHLVATHLFAAGPIQIWTPADLKTSAAQLAAGPDAANIALKTLGSYGSHSISLVRRARSGEAELHKTKADLMVIEEGSATLLVGGSIPDGHVTLPNEIRGKTIQGGELRKVSPGDIIRIPAGTPHQFLLEPGRTVAYFAVKLAR